MRPLLYLWMEGGREIARLEENVRGKRWLQRVYVTTCSPANDSRLFPKYDNGIMHDVYANFFSLMLYFPAGACSVLFEKYWSLQNFFTTVAFDVIHLTYGERHGKHCAIVLVGMAHTTSTQNTHKLLIQFN